MSGLNPNGFPIEQPPTPEPLSIDVASPEGQALLAEPGRGRRGKPREQNSAAVDAPEESPWTPAESDETPQEVATSAPEEDDDNLFIAPNAWSSPSSSDYPAAEINVVPPAPAKKPVPVAPQPVATFGYTGLPGQPTHAITINVPMSAFAPSTVAASAEHQATPVAAAPEEGPQLPAETEAAVEAYEQQFAEGKLFDDLDAVEKLDLVLRIDEEAPEPGSAEYDAYQYLLSGLPDITRKRFDYEVGKRNQLSAPVSPYADPTGINLGGLGGLSIGAPRGPIAPTSTGDHPRAAESISATPEFTAFDMSGFDADQLTTGEAAIQAKYFDGENTDAFRNRPPRAQVAIMLLAAESFTPGATHDEVTLPEAAWHTVVESLDPAVRDQILAQLPAPVTAQKRPGHTEREATPSARPGRFARVLGSIGIGRAAPRPESAEPQITVVGEEGTPLPDELSNAVPITHEPRGFLGRKPKERTPRPTVDTRKYPRADRERGIK